MSNRLLGPKFKERIKKIISDPAFDKPIANLYKDYSKQGTITLVTKIQNQYTNMEVRKKDVYKTPSGKFIQVTETRESGLHHFIEVEDNVNRNPIPEQRNNFGHVIRRNKLVYSEETIATFKKLKPIST